MHLKSTIAFLFCLPDQTIHLRNQMTNHCDFTNSDLTQDATLIFKL